MELIARSSQPMECLLSWTGPLGANQDFSNHESAIEVKTSKATSPSINVSNELQLDSSVVDSLWLCVIHVDDINNGPNTLSRLIAEIKGQLEKDSRMLGLFDEKLEKIGIPVGGGENYAGTGFVIRSKNMYSVRGAFPAITNMTLNNPAIHNVSYQIEIAALEPFRIDVEDNLNHFIC